MADNASSQQQKSTEHSVNNVDEKEELSQPAQASTKQVENKENGTLTNLVPDTSSAQNEKTEEKATKENKDAKGEIKDETENKDASKKKAEKEEEKVNKRTSIAIRCKEGVTSIKSKFRRGELQVPSLSLSFRDLFGPATVSEPPDVNPQDYSERIVSVVSERILPLPGRIAAEQDHICTEIKKKGEHKVIIGKKKKIELNKKSHESEIKDAAVQVCTGSTVKATIAEETWKEIKPEVASSFDGMSYLAKKAALSATKETFKSFISGVVNRLIDELINSSDDKKLESTPSEQANSKMNQKEATDHDEEKAENPKQQVPTEPSEQIKSPKVKEIILQPEDKIGDTAVALDDNKENINQAAVSSTKTYSTEITPSVSPASVDKGAIAA